MISALILVVSLSSFYALEMTVEESCKKFIEKCHSISYDAQ